MPTASGISFKIRAGEQKEVPTERESDQPVLGFPQAPFLLFLQKSSPAVGRQEERGGLGLKPVGRHSLGSHQALKSPTAVWEQ